MTPRIRIVPLSEISSHPTLSLLARDYVQSDTAPLAQERPEDHDGDAPEVYRADD